MVDEKLLERVLDKFHSLTKELDRLDEMAADTTVFQEMDRFFEQKKLEEIEKLKKKQKQIETYLKFAQGFACDLMPAEESLPLNDIRLRKLYMAIDRRSHSDLNAELLYTESCGQLLRIGELIEQLNKDMQDHNQHQQYCEHYQNVERRADETREILWRYANSSIVQTLSRQLKLAIQHPEQTDKIIIGFRFQPLPDRNELREIYQKIFAACYDEATNTLRVPVYRRWDEAFWIHPYEIDQETKILSAVQNELYQLLLFHNKEIEEIYFIDPLHVDFRSLGCLSDYARENNWLIKGVFTSKTEIESALNELWEKICSSTHRRGRIFLFLHDFPDSYNHESLQLIKKICMNAASCDISVILNAVLKERLGSKPEILEYMRLQMGQTVTLSGGQYYISNGKNKRSYVFQWNDGPKELEASFYERVGTSALHSIEHRYEAYVDLSGMPDYHKGIRSNHEIFYAVSDEGLPQFLSFDKTNFATFLCGSSGSGKSTLLHVIITELIRHHHPDDIEIWLVDFKMTEFSRYIHCTAPHMRYIVLDESPELVYDIIDRLMEILVKRQNLFKGRWNQMEEIPVEKYMPTIFVIVDEFAKMSQIIAESVSRGKEDYRLKLQELLSKGRAFGFRFLFSSQGFTSGTRGLNDFSKKQIQQRIAMKTEKKEIQATLDLNRISDRDQTLIENLDVYHTLLKHFRDESGNQLTHAGTVYIEDIQHQMSFIQMLNDQLHRVRRYDPYDENSYIYKKTMIVDGNQYSSFSEVQESISNYIRDKGSDMLSKDSLYLFLGEPRRLMQFLPVILMNSYCENLLIIYPVYETVIACSIFLSLYQSLRMQSTDVEIWSHPSSQLYTILREQTEFRENVISEQTSLFKKMLSIQHQLKEASSNKKVIVIFGLDDILNDLQFAEFAEDIKEKDYSSEVVFEKLKKGELDICSQINLAMNGKIELKIEKQTDAGTANMQAEQPISGFTSKQVYDAYKDLILRGANKGIHVIGFSSQISESAFPLQLNAFKHKVLFRMPNQELLKIMSSSKTSEFKSLDTHIFRYTNGMDAVSYRPYLHDGLTWDGWGSGTSSNAEDEEYLL